MTSGPVLERKGDLAAVLSALEPRDVLFIDEIHRLPRAVEEVLYPAMEDFELDVVLGQGPTARTLRLDLPRFTLVGATTRTGLLTTPLLGRFGVLQRLDYYSVAELAAVVERSSSLLELEVNRAGCEAIAARARGTPRIANRLLRRVRDVAQVEGTPRVDEAAAEHALDVLEVDALGLDELDRLLLRRLTETYEGRPVGLGTLADSVGEAADTIEDVYTLSIMVGGEAKDFERALPVLEAKSPFAPRAPQAGHPWADLHGFRRFQAPGELVPLVDRLFQHLGHADLGGGHGGGRVRGLAAGAHHQHGEGGQGQAQMFKRLFHG